MKNNQYFVGIDIPKSKVPVSENLPGHPHLTLLYLGNVEDDKLKNIIQTINNKIKEKEFTIKVNDFKTFKNGKFPHYGIAYNHRLYNLQKELKYKLPDETKRRFKPHITYDVALRNNKKPKIPNVEIPVKKFYLYKIDKNSYKPVAKFKLEDKNLLYRIYDNVVNFIGDLIHD